MMKSNPNVLAKCLRKLFLTNPWSSLAIKSMEILPDSFPLERLHNRPMAPIQTRKIPM